MTPFRTIVTALEAALAICGKVGQDVDSMEILGKRKAVLRSHVIV
jgi:hypothetical protein